MDYNKSYKDKFRNIEVPKEADLVIENAIKRAKTRHKRRFFKVSSGLVAIFALAIFLGKVSPTFAKYMSNVTSPIKNVFGSIEDSGVNATVKNNFVQYPKNKNNSPLSFTDKGITVTINQISTGGNELLIGYTLKADNRYKDWETLDLNNFSLKDDKGKMLMESKPPDQKFVPCYFDGFYDEFINELNFKDTMSKQGVISFYCNKSKIQIPNSITMNIFGFQENTSVSSYNEGNGFFHKLFHKLFDKSPKTVKGNWSLSLKLDSKFKDSKAKTYVKAKEEKETSSVKIKYINIYPTTVNASIIVPGKKIITHMHLEDEKGTIYKQRLGMEKVIDAKNDIASYRISHPNFESPFFKNSKKLYLILDYKEKDKSKSFKIELKKQQ